MAMSNILADEFWAQTSSITPENMDERKRWLKQLRDSVTPILVQKGLQLSVDTLENLWIPLAIWLSSQRQQLGRPLIQGILGGQGTGKTTMCAILTVILAKLGCKSVSLSLDDLYKTYSDRLLLKQQDPRFIWRGPPGTHDIELGLATLEAIRSSTIVQIPRFDKSAYLGAGDRTASETVTNVDILFFEGWFVGAQPIDPQAFATAPPPIITPEEQEFARDMNTLLHDYIPLWERLDSLIVLYPTDYRCSLQWRQQAEQQMTARGKAGMTDAEVAQFVEYFWRSLHPELFIKPLVESSLVDLVIEIESDRSLGAVYRHKIAIGVKEER